MSEATDVTPPPFWATFHDPSVPIPRAHFWAYLLIANATAFLEAFITDRVVGSIWVALVLIPMATVRRLRDLEISP